MILLVHLLFGAAIGYSIKNVWLAIILAFLGHFFLDLFPHIEYDIESFKENQLYKKVIVVLKVIADICIGLLLILIFSKSFPIIYICAIISALPDSLTLLNWLIPNKALKAVYSFHQKVHFLKHKKISTFWRISSQVVVAVICILLLRA